MVRGRILCKLGGGEISACHCVLLPESMVNTLHISYAIGTDISFVQEVIYVAEANGTAEVCMHITVPSGGLECDIVVSFILVNGTAGGYLPL